MKKIILTFLLLSMIGCNKFDSNLRYHFKKYILIDKFKDYKIKSISRSKGDTLTTKKNLINKIDKNIRELETRNSNYKFNIESSNINIQNIENSKIKIIDVDGNPLTIYEKNGYQVGYMQNGSKENDIKKQNENIAFFNSDISKSERNIINLTTKKNKLSKISNDEMNKILLIYSTVKIIGYNASGENIKIYQVSQDDMGNIKKVTLFK